MKTRIFVVEDGDVYRIQGLPRIIAEKVTSFFELQEARNFSPLTIRAYAFDLVIFFRWLYEKRFTFKNLTAIKLGEFIKFQNRLGSEPASINRRLNSIEVFYRFCFGASIPGKSNILQPTRGQRFLTFDSTLGVHRIHKKSFRNLRVRVTEKRVDPLSVEEVKKFLTSLKTSRDLAMVLVMLMSGLRSMEVIGLKLQDINRVDGSLRIWGKGQKERVVPIPPAVLNTLDKYITLERPHKIKTDHLFVSLKGRSRGLPMTDEGFRSLFRYKRKITGVHKANPHRFRHTFGRDMAVSRVSLRAIMDFFGHRHHKTALRYIKLATGDLFSEFHRASENIHHYYG